MIKIASTTPVPAQEVESEEMPSIVTKIGQTKSA